MERSLGGNRIYYILVAKYDIWGSYFVLYAYMERTCYSVYYDEC